MHLFEANKGQSQREKIRQILKTFQVELEVVIILMCPGNLKKFNLFIFICF